MQGREGAEPGIALLRSHGERCFHPGPRRGLGRECCSCREEGTGMSDNGSMADMALGCRSSLLNAILGLDKQESFASTKSRQRARHPWITLSRLVPPPERFVPMREHCTGHSVPRGLCLGAPCVWHPLPRGLCLGTPCMLQGWDILALLQQHPGAAFLQTGIRDSHVLHSQQGL